jgi:putative Ca2+/H+ antiporter (TMEM165/GDT1 family)
LCRVSRPGKALVLTSAIAVLAGAALTRVVPEIWIHRAAGVGFLIMGMLFLAGKA